MTITIPNLDEASAKWISEEAERRGLSIESLALELIQRGIRVERQTLSVESHHDLDALAGTWSEEQANEFLKAIADFEYVDEKLWHESNI